MFDPGSRYFKLPVATLSVETAGEPPRQVAYVRRRFLPQPQSMVTVVEHTVTEGDRLDNITARYLGDPTQFWRICDANGAMRPGDLVGDGQTGRLVRIALAFS